MSTTDLYSYVATTAAFLVVVLLLGRFGASIFKQKVGALPRTWTALIVILVVIVILGFFGWIIFGVQGWLGIQYFGLTVLGSVGKWIWDAIKSSDSDNPPQLNFYALVPALIFAPIVYGVVLTSLTPSGGTDGTPPNASELIAPYLVAFQNGFFWQTVYDQIAAQG
jgi:hypothetical protein